MNNVQIVGRLTRNPEARYTESGMCIATFTVAVNRIKQGEADFIPCKAFGKTAEILEKYFVKGKEIALTGRINTGSFEKDGKKVYTVDVVADRVEFVGSKAEAKETAEPTAEATADLTDFEALDDIPF